MAQTIETTCLKLKAPLLLKLRFDICQAGGVSRHGERLESFFAMADSLHSHAKAHRNRPRGAFEKFSSRGTKTLVRKREPEPVLRTGLGKSKGVRAVLAPSEATPSK
jgi:hypothetical protein